MFVYLAEDGEYDDRAIAHVASTRELAVMFLEQRVARHGRRWRTVVDDSDDTATIEIMDRDAQWHYFGSVWPMEVDGVK